MIKMTQFMRYTAMASLLIAAPGLEPQQAIAQGGPPGGGGGGNSLQDRVEVLEQGLETEISDRVHADDLETAARVVGDDAAQSNIDQESVNRQDGDHAVQSNLDQEITDRSADVDAEENARESADDTLTAALDELTTVLCQAIQRMAGNPSAEAITLCGGQLSKTVFVTSTLYNGDLKTAGGGATGREGADNICNVRAQSAGLQGTYTAWLSDDTTSASIRVTRADVPYVRTDGVRVADDYADLVTENPEWVLAPIVKTETGGDPSGPTIHVWTGTDALGRVRGFGWSNCSNWTDTSFNGTGGNTTLTHIGWTDNVFAHCFQEYRLYCFQD